MVTINPQLQVARTVLSNISDSNVQEQLFTFLQDIVDEEGSKTKSIELEGVDYTAIFIEEDIRVLVTLRAMPVELKGEAALPIEVRQAIVSPKEEREGCSIDDLSDKKLDERVRMLIQKLKDNTSFLVGNEGLVAFTLPAISASVDTYDPEVFILRSQQNEYFIHNTNFEQSYFVKLHPDFMKLYGSGAIVKIKGRIDSRAITDFHVTFRFRNGEVSFALPFIYLDPKDAPRFTSDKVFRQELINKAVTPFYIQTLFNCLTSLSLTRISQKYNQYWQALVTDKGLSKLFRNPNLQSEYLEILDESKNELVFGFMPYYQVNLFEPDIRAHEGVRLQVSEPSINYRRDLPHVAELIAQTDAALVA